MKTDTKISISIESAEYLRDGAWASLDSVIQSKDRGKEGEALIAAAMARAGTDPEDSVEAVSLDARVYREVCAALDGLPQNKSKDRRKKRAA